MNRSHPRKPSAAVLALAAALAAGSAGAQDLGAYRALASALDGAAAARPSSAERALAGLDRAEDAYARLAPDLSNKQLGAGISRALGDARAALARTPAELQAQVLLARGLMRKALYDQTLAGLAQPTGAQGTPNAAVRLLAGEFGLDPAGTAALTKDAAAGRPERVAWRLQRAASAKVVAALNATRAERTPAAYLNLARATGWFTVAQDAGAAGGLRVAGFTEALTQLTSGDTAALAASLRSLRAGAAAVSRSLATPPRVTSAADPNPAPSPAAARPDAGAASEQQAGRQPAATPSPRPATPAPAAGGVDAAYAALGRALSAAGQGDGPGARTELGRVATALAAAPERLRGAAGYDRLVGDVTAAAERRSPRPTDVQALVAGLSALERRAAGERPGGLAALSATASRAFGGGLRAGLFLLLALLAAVPLYLLNLAFGGRNTYWRAIMAALGLLLLPVVLEGLFGFLGWLGDLTGVGLLGRAPTLTLTQGAYGVPVWALTAALGIGLAAFGFRGLCVQFGLLGGSQAPKNATQPSLDWDEEL